jgi:hypothetical protein
MKSAYRASMFRRRMRQAVRAKKHGLSQAVIVDILKNVSQIRVDIDRLVWATTMATNLSNENFLLISEKLGIGFEGSESFRANQTTH